MLLLLVCFESKRLDYKQHCSVDGGGTNQEVWKLLLQVVPVSHADLLMEF